MTALTTASTRPRSQPRGGLATLAVLLIMLGIVGLGYIAQDAVAGLPPRPVEVTAGVVVTPLEDWEFGGRSEDGTAVLLSQGDGSLGVEVRPGTDVAAVLAALRAEWTGSEAVTASEIEPVTNLRNGQAGQRFAYSGTFEGVPAAVEGEVTAYAGRGIVVLFDGWSGLGSFRNVKSDIEAMINAAVIP